ncbi:MAG: 2,3,4,5-tetrahydropyridine-2,6-dicarboxylate N-succinyltransferase [Candidatus Eisenbacteria bacterium]|nr:2,3,4,5-tetrahydropyridine-2,6-dicarboxylate N-succinyltransferase [Candidatus Latescibacterota bacterium]MBD3303179.1 2,3,4,5-tetrahydropyridine-2,6-dicarboxylate N-succinyltransferase [Candidatus Eisenbacteria bacterium]
MTRETKNGALERTVERAWEDAAFASEPEAADAVRRTIDLLDRGIVRVAEPTNEGWIARSWVRMAVVLYFRLAGAETIPHGPFEYRDKVPLKQDLEKQGIRLVPPGTIRYGAFLEPGTVVMPSYINVGAYVGAGTMVDTWATVGSCAQIGRNVHLSGGVGIGGVLEPLSDDPVIVEDEAFLGSRCVVVEGVRVGRGAVLGAGTILTASTPIVDVRGEEPRVGRGSVPPEVVVIPGTWPKRFPAGVYHLPCALIVRDRGESADRKTRLNPNLRELPLLDDETPDQGGPIDE